MSEFSGCVFVCAGQGSGKSAHAEALRKMFGCTSIVDDWDGESDVPARALVLTNLRPGVDLQRLPGDAQDPAKAA